MMPIGASAPEFSALPEIVHEAAAAAMLIIGLVCPAPAVSVLPDTVQKVFKTEICVSPLAIALITLPTMLQVLCAQLTPTPVPVYSMTLPAQVTDEPAMITTAPPAALRLSRLPEIIDADPVMLMHDAVVVSIALPEMTFALDVVKIPVPDVTEIVLFDTVLRIEPPV